MGRQIDTHTYSAGSIWSTYINCLLLVDICIVYTEKKNIRNNLNETDIFYFYMIWILQVASIKHFHIEILISEISNLMIWKYANIVSIADSLGHWPTPRWLSIFSLALNNTETMLRQNCLLHSHIPSTDYTSFAEACALRQNWSDVGLVLDNNFTCIAVAIKLTVTICKFKYDIFYINKSNYDMFCPTAWLYFQYICSCGARGRYYSRRYRHKRDVNDK